MNRSRYPTPPVTYRLVDLTDPHPQTLPSSYFTAGEAWARGAQRWLRNGGDREVAMQMLDMDEPGTVQEWQVSRRCETTTTPHVQGWDMPASWHDALTLATRGAFESTYRELAAALIDSLIDDPCCGLDVALHTQSNSLVIGIAVGVDNDVVVFADGTRQDLLTTRQVLVTNGGL